MNWVLGARASKGVVQLGTHQKSRDGLRRRRGEDGFNLRVAHVIQERSAGDDQVGLDVEVAWAGEDVSAEAGGLWNVVLGPHGAAHERDQCKCTR